ncbi:MAG: hypothetical protein V3V02_00815 [Rhizobiaceae bacterium]
MKYARAKGAPYTPIYFLSSLGAGGLVVSFFMYLMFLTPHKGSPIPYFNTIVPAFQNGSIPMQAMIAVAVIGIIVFAFLHFKTLLWNVSEYRKWKNTDAYSVFVKGNNESQLMAMPLAFAMTVNMSFIVGAVLVPGLWEVAQYLFPFAVIAFLVTAYYALKIFGDFFGRVLTEGGFDCAKNNSFGQMLSVFAFAMIGVGFSATTAMSHNIPLVITAFFLSAIFIMAAVVLGAIFLVMGFRAMMEHAAEKETTPTLWIIIPFITVVGIAIFRMFKSLDHNFGVEWANGSIFSFLMMLFAIQLVFGFLGFVVMKRVGYYGHYVSGEAISPGAFTLICPGVSIFVFANFVINPGLAGLGVVDQLSYVHLALYVPLVLVQIKTVMTYFRLNNKMLHNEPSAPASIVPAE